MDHGQHVGVVNFDRSTVEPLPFRYGLPRFSLKYTKEAPYGEALHNTKEVLKEHQMTLPKIAIFTRNS